MSFEVRPSSVFPYLSQPPARARSDLERRPAARVCFGAPAGTDTPQLGYLALDSPPSIAAKGIPVTFSMLSRGTTPRF